MLTECNLQLKVVLVFLPHLVGLCRCSRCIGRERCLPAGPCRCRAASTDTLHTAGRTHTRFRKAIKTNQVVTGIQQLTWIMKSFSSSTSQIHRTISWSLVSTAPESTLRGGVVTSKSPPKSSSLHPQLSVDQSLMLSSSTAAETNSWFIHTTGTTFCSDNLAQLILKFLNI